MIVKKLAIATCCFAIFSQTSTYASSSSDGDLGQNGGYIPILLSQSQNEWVRSLSRTVGEEQGNESGRGYPYGTTTSNKGQPLPQDGEAMDKQQPQYGGKMDKKESASEQDVNSLKSGEAVITYDSVDKMLDNLDETIAIAKDPTQYNDSLPELNKHLLREVAYRLVDDHPEYEDLLKNTEEISKKYYDKYNYFTSHKGIDYGLILSPDYSTYLDLDHIIYLTTVWIVENISKMKGIIAPGDPETIIAIVNNVDAVAVDEGGYDDFLFLLDKLSGIVGEETVI